MSTLKLPTNQINIVIDHYKDYTINPTNNYTLFRAKYNSSIITIFKTNTILIQGKDDNETYKEICSLLQIPLDDEEGKMNSNLDITALKNLIGTDEVGTGDFFGGIIVAGAYVPIEKFTYLKKLGVKDSKEISDFKILEIAPQIIKSVIYSISKLDNIHYNYLIEHNKLNMNNIKALMHNSVINSLKQKVDNYDGIIIDAFTTPNNYFNYLKNEKKVATDVILEEKAENKFLCVACASIIARYYLLKEFESLSLNIGLELPKGAGRPVDAIILKIINEKGIDILKHISKMNFKNISKVMK